jgi:hypothetical protein
MRFPLLAALAALAALATPAPAQATSPSANPDAETALQRAVNVLLDSSFRFDYSFWPSPDSTGFTTGSGYGEMSTTTWHYTVAMDPPGAADGTWIIKDGTWYQDGEVASPDFTFMGVAGVITPFASYKAMSAAPGFVPLEHVGTAVIDGLSAEHYVFAAEDMPVYGTAVYEAYLSASADGFERIILVFSPEGGQASRVTFSHIGEHMAVSAP